MSGKRIERRRRKVGSVSLKGAKQVRHAPKGHSRSEEALETVLTKIIEGNELNEERFS